MFSQGIQVFGSLLILLAFTALRSGRLKEHSWAYLVLNIVGATILGVISVRIQQWGFVMLNSAWVLVSLHGIYENVARRGISAAARDAVEEDKK